MKEIGGDMLLVAAMVAATMLTRFLPFLIFRGGKPTPPFVVFLGKTLPYATIGLLVVYCLKTPILSVASQLSGQNGGEIIKNPGAWGIPEWIAVCAVAVLHMWKKNSLISIGIGTVLYMVLVQLVFV